MTDPVVVASISIALAGGGLFALLRAPRALTEGEVQSAVAGLPPEYRAIALRETDTTRRVMPLDRRQMGIIVDTVERLAVEHGTMSPH